MFRRISEEPVARNVMQYQIPELPNNIPVPDLEQIQPAQIDRDQFNKPCGELNNAAS